MPHSTAPSLRAAVLIACMACLVAAPTRAQAPDEAQSRGIPPRDAIWMAAAARPEAVPGVFALRVQASALERGMGYLNSERDYRDPRNVTLRVVGRALEALGPDPAAALRAFVGERVVVQGAVRTRRIDFGVNGRPSGKYYYQTHIDVTEPGQIIRATGAASAHIVP